MELTLNLLHEFLFNVSLNHQGITGQAVNILIQRKADNYYYTGSTWSATLTELSMTKKSDTDYPGVHTYDFTPVTADVYVVTYRIDGGSYACNVSETWPCLANNANTNATAVATIPTNPLLTTDGRLTAYTTALTLLRQLLGNEQVTVQITGETYLITYDDSGIAGNAPVSSLKLRTFADAVIGDLTSTTAPMRRLKVL